MTGQQERNLFVVALRLWLFLGAVSMVCALLLVFGKIILQSPILSVGVVILGIWYVRTRKPAVKAPSTFRRFVNLFVDLFRAFDGLFKNKTA